jgi:acyl-homoserine lactone acylase PvdQ
MERTRRVFNGEAAEIFGDKALIVDKIARSIGYRRLAVKAFPALREET